MNDDGQTQISSFAANVIIRNTSILQTCIEKTRDRNESEDIHDLRVSSRRVRVALEVFRQFLPAKKFKDWEPAIADLTKAFGNARDLDVQLTYLKEFFQKNDDIKTRPGGKRIRLRIEQRLYKGEQRLQNKVKEIEKTGLLQEIVHDLKPQAVVVPKKIIPPSPIFELSFNVLNKKLDEFLFYEIYLPFPERIKELHLMRIASKHLRYSLEIFAPLYPDQLEKILEIMRIVQTGLGEIRDCDVWLAYLPQFMEKEKKRVLAYFGNPRPFQRLVQGVELVLNDRKREREMLYTEFLDKWKAWRMGETWSNLRQAIFNPVLANPAFPNTEANNTRTI